MLIYLIRHGETDFNLERRYQGMWGESRLTEDGKKQALSAARLLSAVPFDRIYVSAALRTRETAALLFPEREDFILRDELREVDTGELTNQLYDECRVRLADKFAAVKRQGDFSVFGGESFEDIQGRAARIAKEICEGGGDTVAAVSHGGFIRYIIEALTGIPSMSLAIPRNCSYAVVDYDGEKGVLKLFGATAEDNLFLPIKKAGHAF